MEKTAAKLEDSSGYGSTKIIQIDKSLLQTANTVKVAFNDNKLGGVGAVTLCVGSRINGSGLRTLQNEPAELHPITPNPVKGSARITFTLNNPAQTTVKIFNLQGKEVATVASCHLESGSYGYNFSAKPLRAGVYFCRLEAGVNDYTRKMVVR